eukprot:2058964-Pleurochrysis_carterae.AAC.2
MAHTENEARLLRSIQTPASKYDKLRIFCRCRNIKASPPTLTHFANRSQVVCRGSFGPQEARSRSVFYGHGIPMGFVLRSTLPFDKESTATASASDDDGDWGDAGSAIVSVIVSADVDISCD